MWPENGCIVYEICASWISASCPVVVHYNLKNLKNKNLKTFSLKNLVLSTPAELTAYGVIAHTLAGSWRGCRLINYFTKTGKVSGIGVAKKSTRVSLLFQYLSTHGSLRGHSVKQPNCTQFIAPSRVPERPFRCIPAFTFTTGSPVVLKPRLSWLKPSVISSMETNCYLITWLLSLL